MRRLVAVLAVLCFAAGVLASLATPSVAASRASLTVIALGRDGKPEHVQAEVLSVTRFVSRYITTGHAVGLKPGTYDVLVDIFDALGTDTMAAERVKVHGTKTITIDARRGRPIRARLAPAAPDGYRQHFQMALCDQLQDTGLVGFTEGSVLYAIPSSISTVELAYSSVWQPQDDSSSDPRFLAGTVHRHGIPTGGTKTFRQATLATVSVQARRGPETGDADVELSADSQDNCLDGEQQLSTTTTLPFSFTAHVTPGSWSTSETAQDVLSGPWISYRAGHHYGVTVNRSVWGPAGRLPCTGGHHNLFLNMTMFGDPTLPDDGANAREHYTLSKGGRTLFERTTNTYRGPLDPVLKARGWYTLSITANRHPRHPLARDALSTTSSLRLRFYADLHKREQVRGYLTEFRPAGLDSDNRAAPAATTAVGLGLQRQNADDSSIRQLPDGVHSVHVWASDDGGRSWHAVPVSHTHGRWTARVPDPRSGYVSLRSTVADTHGSSSTTTVIRAYGIR